MCIFSRTYRLVRKEEFQSVFAKPQKVSRGYLLALYRTNQYSHARLGIIVAKHHVKRAADRNQIRRVIRESFRHHIKSLKGLDIIVLIRSECTPLIDKVRGKKKLRDDIDTLWQKLLAPSSKLV